MCNYLELAPVKRMLRVEFYLKFTLDLSMIVIAFRVWTRKFAPRTKELWIERLRHSVWSH